MSLEASEPITLASTTVPSISVTLTLSAPSMTWKFVNTVPSPSTMNPVPSPVGTTPDGTCDRPFRDRAIAEAVDIPQILYNVPGRTVADLQNDTTLRLAQIPNIIGLKDATANLERGADLIRQLPAGFAVYSGDDATCLALMLLGGQGVISVTANVAPRAMHEMCVAALKPEPARAREINNRLMGLHRHLFVEANPIPVKWAVASMKLMKHGIRLPLTPLAAEYHERVRGAMKQAGINL